MHLDVAPDFEKPTMQEEDDRLLSSSTRQNSPPTWAVGSVKVRVDLGRRAGGGGRLKMHGAGWGTLYLGLF
jgi:hypothetical protein